VIPTRIDIAPYKFGPFAKANKGIGQKVEIFKFLLVLYTFKIVKENYAQKLKKK